MLVDDQGQNFVASNAGKAGILAEVGSQDREISWSQGNGVPGTYAIPLSPARRGAYHYRNDIVEQRVGEWVATCPSAQGSKNWPSMTYYAPKVLADYPIEPKLHKL